MQSRNIQTTTNAFAELERQATARARGERAQTPALYVQDGGNVPLTPERAVAEMLEVNPQIYAEYRKRHNAGAILHTLAAAGIRVPGA